MPCLSSKFLKTCIEFPFDFSVDGVFVLVEHAFDAGDILLLETLLVLLTEGQQTLLEQDVGQALELVKLALQHAEPFHDFHGQVLLLFHESFEYHPGRRVVAEREFLAEFVEQTAGLSVVDRHLLYHRTLDGRFFHYEPLFLYQPQNETLDEAQGFLRTFNQDLVHVVGQHRMLLLVIADYVIQEFVVEHFDAERLQGGHPEVERSQDALGRPVLEIHELEQFVEEGQQSDDAQGFRQFA
eukprot:CAMPEP_0116964038 /NCGR_PEP_ID=MMETSP0467-20121206/48301_1 /TAXON_ID=283647 /ORGANISM="Mesodinium pulex, Strain SPMC105" /LENGTH=239 /DNA_ID=CAMNT_0004652847 /DNA_START=194 /DNA_END=912 /DNA_ORIENTATION=+